MSYNFSRTRWGAVVGAGDHEEEKSENASIGATTITQILPSGRIMNLALGSPRYASTPIGTPSSSNTSLVGRPLRGVHKEESEENKDDVAAVGGLLQRILNLEDRANAYHPLHLGLPPVTPTSSLDSTAVSDGSPTKKRAVYSKKVFVGGLPPDIDADRITVSFRPYGLLQVGWPHKMESQSSYPPKGFAFLQFEEEESVHRLINACLIDGTGYYTLVSSPSVANKPVQVRPWNIEDADYMVEGAKLDPRKTVFVGGVPRPLKSKQLAKIMQSLYGAVCYAGIDVDSELSYPKGAGRVVFRSKESCIAAISARFVQIDLDDINKRVEVKPFILQDQMCDHCNGNKCSGQLAPYFCANVACLQYMCVECWAEVHSFHGRQFHKPLLQKCNMDQQPETRQRTVYQPWH